MLSYAVEDMDESSLPGLAKLAFLPPCLAIEAAAAAKAVRADDEESQSLFILWSAMLLSRPDGLLI